MKFLPLAFFSIACLGLTAVSCSDDKNDPNPDPVPPTPDENETPMTPTESKQFLSTTASDFMNQFRPQDQKEVMDLANDFFDRYGEFEMPSEWEDLAEEKSPARFMRRLAAGVRGASAPQLAAAVQEWTVNINFPRFAGVYEPQGGAWVRTAKSNDIVFRFTDSTGARCEITAKALEGTNDGTYKYIDSWEDWDYENGYVEYEDRYNVVYSVPRRTDVTLTKNGSKLVDGQVKIKVDLDGHTLSSSTNATVANINATYAIDGNDSKITASSTLTVSGTMLMETYAEVSGHDLCNKGKLENEDWDDAAGCMTRYFTEGRSQTNIMGKVQLYTAITMSRPLAGVLTSDMYWDSYDYSSKETAEKECKKAADILNERISARVCYKGTGTEQAKIVFKPMFDSWGYDDDWEYYLDGVLMFPDESTYSFGEYFGRGFSSVSDQFESLFENYSKVWNQSAARH